MTYIGFGTNLGDVKENYAAVCWHLQNAANVTLLRTSELYITEPLTLDGAPQPWYLNCVFEIATDLSPHELFDTLKAIEFKMGRRRQKRWAPRIADLDILFYDRLIYTDRVLTLPHRGITQRAFVLAPLCDLIPDFLHPEYEMTVAELAKVASRDLAVRVVEA